MERFEYAVLLDAAEEGGFVVTCRDLPELVTQGDDREHALSEATDAMDEVFALYMSEGLAFPPPTRARRREHLISPPPETVAKSALHAAMRSASVSKGQLARRLGPGLSLTPSCDLHPDMRPLNT